MALTIKSVVQKKFITKKTTHIPKSWKTAQLKKKRGGAALRSTSLGSLLSHLLDKFLQDKILSK